MARSPAGVSQIASVPSGTRASAACRTMADAPLFAAALFAAALFAAALFALFGAPASAAVA
jgi:hypothetical protein